MKRTLQLALVTLSLGVMTAVAAPPTDEAVTAALEAFNEANKNLDRSDRDAYMKGVQQAAATAVKDINLAEASVEQINKLSRVLSTADMGPQVLARLDVLARDTGKDGADAAIARLGFLPSTFVPRENATDAHRERAAEARKVHEAALQQLVDHPALPAAMAESGAVFSALRGVDRQVMASAGPQMTKLASMLPDAMPPQLAMGLGNFFDTLASVENMDAADRERIRTRMVAALQAVQGEGDDNAKRNLARTLAYVDGAHARGTLVGHASPPLDITWSNYGEPIKSIADLKGKVVVIDFWATWCGPCIGSFPQVRELQAHYKDSPVVILGVTSLQGYHMDRPSGASGSAKRIDTKDKPEQEHELMNTFVKQLEMTWPVAFTQQDVFNPDYGVRGIPHVAILDPNGVVRYRGMHPGSDSAGKREKIDGLLREFNLPVPAAPAAAAEATAAS